MFSELRRKKGSGALPVKILLEMFIENNKIVNYSTIMIKFCEKIHMTNKRCLSVTPLYSLISSIFGYFYFSIQELCISTKICMSNPF